MELFEMETGGVNITAAEKKILLVSIGYLKAQPTESMYVPYNDAQKYRGDFYGVLNYMAIPVDSWFANLLINDYRSPEQYNGESGIIYTLDNQWVRTMIDNSLAINYEPLEAKLVV